MIDGLFTQLAGKLIHYHILFTELHITRLID